MSKMSKFHGMRLLSVLTALSCTFPLMASSNTEQNPLDSIEVIENTLRRVDPVADQAKFILVGEFSSSTHNAKLIFSIVTPNKKVIQKVFRPFAFHGPMRIVLRVPDPIPGLYVLRIRNASEGKNATQIQFDLKQNVEGESQFLASHTLKVRSNSHRPERKQIIFEFKNPDHNPVLLGWNPFDHL